MRYLYTLPSSRKFKVLQSCVTKKNGSNTLDRDDVTNEKQICKM